MTVSAPPVPPLSPPIGVKELDISIPTTRPASPQLPKPYMDDASDLLTEEYDPVLQWSFHLVTSEPTARFAGSPADLTRRLWDLMDAHRTRRECGSHTAKAPGVDLISPSIPRYVDDPSLGSNTTGTLLFPLSSFSACSDAIRWGSFSCRYGPVHDGSVHQFLLS